MGTGSKITLYCEGTPNPLKISIALEELGLEYNVQIHTLSLVGGDLDNPDVFHVLDPRNQAL